VVEVDLENFHVEKIVFQSPPPCATHVCRGSQFCLSLICAAEPIHRSPDSGATTAPEILFIGGPQCFPSAKRYPCAGPPYITHERPWLEWSVFMHVHAEMPGDAIG
jgi:hypothetical protein